MIINILSDIKIKLWDIQKNTEEDVKSAQKKEELEKETKENKYQLHDTIMTSAHFVNKIKKYSVISFVLPLIAINRQ